MTIRVYSIGVQRHAQLTDVSTPHKPEELGFLQQFGFNPSVTLNNNSYIQSNGDWFELHGDTPNGNTARIVSQYTFLYGTGLCLEWQSTVQLGNAILNGYETMGFHDNGAPNNLVVTGWRSTAYQHLTMSGGVGTTQALGGSPDWTSAEVEVKITWSAGNSRVYTDGTLNGTITTNVPTVRLYTYYSCENGALLASAPSITFKETKISEV